MRLINNKFIKYISFLLFLALYLLLILLLDINCLEEGYIITVFLPIVFLICFYVFLWEPVLQKRTPYIVLFSCVSFVRYVVLSIATIWNGTYRGLSDLPPSNESLTLAGILMAWELIVLSALICYWLKKKINLPISENHKITFKANPAIYMLFIIASTLCLFIVPEARQGLSFFGDINRGMNDETNSLLVLGIRECFINAKYFMLFLVIIMLNRKKGTMYINKAVSYVSALVASLLIIGLRIGANRKKILADSIAAMLILWRLFPKYRRTTLIVLSVGGLGIVITTTIFRGMADSPFVFFGNFFNVNFLQAYFLGQYNIAIAIEAKGLFAEMIGIKTYILDFLRPIFGIGQLVKNISYTSAAAMFNTRISIGLSAVRTDQILPMIGQGYILFGFLFSPILSVIVARMGIFFDTLYAKSRRLEIVFIASVISFYLAQGMILNFTIILNTLSYKLIIFIPIVYVAYIGNRRANKSLKM